MMIEQTLVSLTSFGKDSVAFGHPYIDQDRDNI